MKLADNVFVVTGGGNGIGREVVGELLRRGARVAAVDVRADALEATADLVDAAHARSTDCSTSPASSSSSSRSPSWATTTWRRCSP